MADTLTTNYGWVMPEDQASADTWGQKINADLQAIDSVVFQTAQAYVGQINPGSIAFSNPLAAAGQQVRWTMSLINAETGTPVNTGSDLAISRFSDTGAALPSAGAPFGTSPPLITINRATGAATIYSAATFVQPLTVQANLIIPSTSELILAGSKILFAAATYPTGVQSGSIANGGTYLGIVGGSGAAQATLNIGNIGSHSGAILAAQQGLFIAPTVTSGNNPAISFCDSSFVVRATMTVNVVTAAQVLTIDNGGSSLKLDQTNSFTFTGSGNAYKAGGGSWAALSDERIKIIEGDYADGLQQVLGLNPVVYRYKGNDGEKMPTDDLRVGLIAQEVERVMPAMVTLSPGVIDGKPVTDLRRLDTSDLIFALVNSIKELHARIEELEGR